MKSLLSIFSALLIILSVGFVFAESDTTSTETTIEESSVEEADVASAGTSKNRGIIPQDKTNWSKIKDIFM